MPEPLTIHLASQQCRDVVIRHVIVSPARLYFIRRMGKKTFPPLELVRLNGTPCVHGTAGIITLVFTCSAGVTSLAGVTCLAGVTYLAGVIWLAGVTWLAGLTISPKFHDARQSPRAHRNNAALTHKEISKPAVYSGYIHVSEEGWCVSPAYFQ